MKPYSMDLRERVLAACDAGSGTKAVADRFAVSESWVRRLKQQRRNGQTAPRPPRNHRAPKLAPHADAIRTLIAATPDLTLAEIRTQLGLAVALGTLWAAVARLGLTVKKKSSGRPSRIART
jgi:transposase